MKSKLMKANFKPIVFLLVFTIFSCKKESTFNDFKFESKGIVVDCENKKLNALINEALFSFEDDITKTYSKEKPNLQTAYSQFIRNAINGRINYADVVSPHTVKVFEALKQENSFWDAENDKSYLNYNGSFVNCIGDKIQDKDLKTTLKALISTNSMNPKLFGAPLMASYRLAQSDKYVAAYVAFDLCYAKLFNVDLSGVKEKTETKIDFNKVPK